MTFTTSNTGVHWSTNDSSSGFVMRSVRTLVGLLIRNVVTSPRHASAQVGG